METITKQSANITKPRLGFLGVGWIGRSRLEAIAKEDKAVIAAICDASEATVTDVQAAFNVRKTLPSLEKLLQENVDGIIIATPSALHTQQTLQALQAGKAVFCQKPLARTAEETREVVEAARKANRLLGVDFSYRHTEGMQQLKKVVENGDIGNVFAAELTFHNAYGPDKNWYYQPELAGGGCLMDLGIHLVDMLVWLFPDAELEQSCSQLFHQGKAIPKPEQQVEDYATAQVRLNTGLTANLSCSWNVSAGKDAIIEARFYGTKGGVCFRNVNGSFYDFQTEIYHGTKTEILVQPPDDWSGRAAVVWASQLATSPAFDPAAEQFVKVAEVLDVLYKR